jgi:ATP synthase subunit 6
MYSPLEQFDVFKLIILKFASLDISILNILLPFCIINFLFIYFINIYKINSKLISDAIQNFLELLYKFILNIVIQQLGNKGLNYFHLMFIIFNFIFFSNLLSLVPFGIAITSHVILIFFLSFTICISIFIIGLIKHYLEFLKIFIPQSPLILLLILIPIEIFSYLIRMFSLAIRLAANILAGHTLVHIISTFVLNLTFIKWWLIFIISIPLLMIIGLEIGIAFLQAYVFTILVSIYLLDALNGPKH